MSTFFGMWAQRNAAYPRIAANKENQKTSRIANKPNYILCIGYSDGSSCVKQVEYIPEALDVLNGSHLGQFLFVVQLSANLDEVFYSESVKISYSAKTESDIWV